VRIHDALHDREAKAGPDGGEALAAPESFENHLTPIRGNAGAAIHDADAPATFHGDAHLRPRRRMGDCILDEIPDHIFDRMAVPPDSNRFTRPRKGDRALLPQSKRGHGGHGPGGNLIEVHRAGNVQRHGVEPGHAPALVAPSVLIELMVVVVIRAETAGFRVDRYSLGLSVLGCDDAKILSIDNQVNIRPAIRQHFFSAPALRSPVGRPQ
jgi:hypothetical protein